MAARAAQEPTSTDGLSAVLPIIGLVVVFGSIIGGFVEAGGHLAVLWQPAEFIIIGGAGIGSFIVGNPMSVIKASWQ